MKLRRERPPAAVSDLLDPDERAVAWSVGVDAELVVATTFGLWLPGPVRVSWHLITHVTWSGTTLTVTTATEIEPGILEEQSPHRVRLTEPRDLPETVEKRFYSSRAHSVRHTLSGGGGVIVVARRVPGRDGVTCYAVCDKPQLRFDPQAHAEIMMLVEQTRALFEVDSSA